jgi:hypothetical protein
LLHSDRSHHLNEINKAAYKCIDEVLSALENMDNFVVMQVTDKMLTVTEIVVGNNRTRRIKEFQ